MERLQKVLAQAGVGSRRSCEELIRAGRVQVNGKVVSELGTKVQPETDVICVDGKRIEREPFVYLLLYKPAGYITSLRDPQGRRVVTELLADVAERVYPVGRLDYDTSGLLLLTNDGELAHQITHPSRELDKVYHAWVKGQPDHSTLARLARGVLLEDGWTAPGKARLLAVDRRRNRSLLELTIHEGRNRQVRRMCDAVGHPVIALERVRLGDLTLDGLKPGEYRRLTDEEINRLRERLKRAATRAKPRDRSKSVHK